MFEIISRRAPPDDRWRIPAAARLLCEPREHASSAQVWLAPSGGYGSSPLRIFKSDAGFA
ncbi:hypothetical protein DMH17_15220 [Raoultella planticola]|nr:hypothetical protein [Raoultella planticola]